MTGPSGQPFGKYLLLDRIATGGMAEIFRAKYVAAAGVTKPVVIKRILPHYAGNPAFVSMFTNEAKIAMGLAHGNIAQVFDFGEINGEYFLAMELVNGQSLARLARSARDQGYRIPLPIAAFIVAEVCAGLHYAHALPDEKGKPLGIVHRDVSPQNVIVSYEGQVKLVDFGIAKMRSAGKGETEHGAVKGKYLYFSPEQARGKNLDGRSDIYAAGILLYEITTGARPFEGRMPEVLAAIARGEFERPSKLDSFIPEELEAIILKAMAIRPEDRYATAVEMQDALRHFVHEADPTFSAASVGQFVSFIAREDLDREGVRVDLPGSFIQKLERWREDPLLDAESRSTAITAPDQPLAPPDRLPLGGPLTRSVVLMLGVIAVGMIAGLLIAVGLAHRSAKGAKIQKEYAAQQQAAKAAALRESQGPKLPEKPRDDLRDPVEGPASAPVAEWPIHRQLSLEREAHALPMASTAAARTRLDPARSYRLSLEGSAEIVAASGPRPLREVVYFVERVPDAVGEGGAGVLSPDGAAVVSGAQALYAVVLRRPVERASGALRVRITDLKTSRSGVLAVDAESNALPLDARLPRVSGLDPAEAYELGLAGREADRLLVVSDAGSLPVAALQAGTRRVVREASGFWVLLPEELAEEPGDLTITVGPVGRDLR